MAYCKTKTYINLKRTADRCYRRAVETGCDDAWELFEEYELEVSDYAYINEADIDWTQVNGTDN